MRILLVLILFTLTFSWAEDKPKPRKYVNSVEDFYIHTQNHVNNVERLGEHLMDLIFSDPKYIPYLKENFGIETVEQVTRMRYLGKRMLKIHDYAKLDVHGNRVPILPGDKAMLYHLYDSYGVVIKDTDKKAKGDYKAKLDKLNYLDEKILEEFYIKNHLSENQIKFLQMIELLADKAERAMNPVTPEEMGRKVISGTVYLKDELKPIELELLGQLENDYKNIAVTFDSKKVQLKTLKLTLKGMMPSMRALTDLQFYERAGSLFTDVDLDSLPKQPGGLKLIGTSILNFTPIQVEPQTPCFQDMLKFLVSSKPEVKPKTKSKH